MGKLEHAYLRKEQIDRRSRWREVVDTRVDMQFTGFADVHEGLTRIYDLSGRMVDMREIGIESVWFGPVETILFGWVGWIRTGLGRAAVAGATAATTQAGLRLAASFAGAVDKLRLLAVPLASASAAAAKVIQNRPTIIDGHHRAISVINAVLRGHLSPDTVVGKIDRLPLTAGVLTRLFEQGALGVSRLRFVPAQVMQVINYQAAKGLHRGGIIIGNRASPAIQAMRSERGQTLEKFIRKQMH